MSTMQRLTLIGLYNYDSTLFDGLTLPEEYDKDIFIDSLLLEHGEKCVLYSNPDFMKYSIGAWGRKWSLELERIAEALQAEYNPIYNYDRYEDWTETDKPDVTTTRTHNDTDTQTLNNSTTRTHNNTDTQTNRYDVVTEQNVDGNAEHQISADNSSSYQPESKDITNSGKTTVSNDGTITDAHTGTVTDANSGTITDAHTGTITDAEKGTRSNIDHDGHLYGNIGVITSAAMVSEVVAQRYRYNLYGTAARIFANELLIGIY